MHDDDSPEIVQLEMMPKIRIHHTSGSSQLTKKLHSTEITDFHGVSSAMILARCLLLQQYNLSERVTDDGPKYRKSARSRHLRHEGSSNNIHLVRTDALINTIR